MRGAAVIQKIMEVAVDLRWVYCSEVTVGGSAPVVDAVAARDVEVLEQVSDYMVMNFMRADAVLRTSDNHIINVMACRDQGVNDFTDTTAVSEAHPCSKLFLLLLIRVADAGLAGKGGHLTGTLADVHPSVKMLHRHTGDVRFD